MSLLRPVGRFEFFHKRLHENSMLRGRDQRPQGGRLSKQPIQRERPDLLRRRRSIGGGFQLTVHTFWGVDAKDIERTWQLFSLPGEVRGRKFGKRC